MATTILSSQSTSLKLNPKTLRTFEYQLHIPPLLRPLLRAYLLGYASSIGPRLLALVLRQLSRSRKRVKIANGDGPSNNVFFHSLLGILRGGLELQRFPTSCAVLVGGSTLLQIPIRRLLERLVKTLSSSSKARLSQGLATFISAYLSLALLQSKQTPDFVDWVPPNTYDKLTGKRLKTTEYAGRTLDLTLFAFTRAMDVIIGSLWQSHNTTHQTISYLTDPFLFATSSALIMWSWLYFPDRLPRNYNNWITTAAAVDPHLVNALRVCRQGKLLYGQSYPPNSPGFVLQDMCKDYGWPVEWGDPTKSVPFPCTMVHMHSGPNCEYHALSRFVRSFKWALEYNLPLNLVLKLKNPSRDALEKAIASSIRSSAFLAAFISLFYYGVCLCRTRSQQFGPIRRLFMKLLGIKEKARHHPDFSRSQKSGDLESRSHPVALISASTSTETATQTSRPRSTSILEIDFSNPSNLSIFSPPSSSPATTAATTPSPTTTTHPTTTHPNPQPQQIISPHTQLSQAIDSGLCSAAGCLLCGWSILLESSIGTRRAELSLFVLPRALRTLFDKRYGKEREWVERVVFAGSAVVVVEAVGGGGRLMGPRGVFGRLVRGVLA